MPVLFEILLVGLGGWVGLRMIRSGISAITAGELRPVDTPDEEAAPHRIRRETYPKIFWFNVVWLIGGGVAAAIFAITVCAGLVKFS